VRFIQRSAPRTEERLLWSRDERLVTQLAESLPGSRVVPIASGAYLIASSPELTDAFVSSRTQDTRYGLVTLEQSVEPGDRVAIALADAVQQSGLADRIGMGITSLAADNRRLDSFLFWARRQGLEFRFQPLVTLDRLQAVAYETLCRPGTNLDRIDQIVAAAVNTSRTSELDRLIVEQIFERLQHLTYVPRHLTINVLPASLADAFFEAKSLAARCRAAGLEPSRVTLECTEQQSAPDMSALLRRVRQLRLEGFGFAVDDAGAGYASFDLIVKLRPSLIKIDMEFVQGVATDDAKQALIEAYVLFARRINADLVAEGIERMNDLETLQRLGVQLGQGWLFGKPAEEPERPRLPGPTAVDDDASAQAPVARTQPVGLAS
jgi:EAL domain-containing protein (putative c-di-GMP-specific phosphodiesterase class I)